MKMTEKVKGAACVALPVLAAAAHAMTSFAAEDGGASVTDTATSALTSAVTDMASSVAGAIGSVIPIAIPLVGAALVVTIGLKVFKMIANKA